MFNPVVEAGMSLSLENQELLEKALYRRRLFRWWLKFGAFAILVLSTIPLTWLFRKASTHLKATSRLDSLGGKVDYYFDSEGWKFGGTSLVRFDFNSYLFRKQAPLTELSALEDLQRVTSLDLSRLDRDDLNDFGFLKNLTELEILRVDRLTPIWSGIPPLRGFSNRILDDLPNSSALRTVHLQGNRITDAGLKRLAQLPKLEELDLSGTLVTDAGLKQLAKFRSLLVLNLSQSKVTSAGVQALQTARPELQIEFDPTQKPFHRD